MIRSKKKTGWSITDTIIFEGIDFKKIFSYESFE